MSEQRLIDANRLIDFIDCGHLRNPLELCFSESEVVNMLDSAPTIPAEIVVHGRWREDTDPADGDLRCTHCGIAWPKCVQKQIEEQGIWTLQTLFKYCPNCGAKMDKETENERDD